MMARVIKIIIMFLVISFPQLFYGKEFSYKLILEPESKLWLEGDSTLHRYECYATVINLDNSLELKADPGNEQNAGLLKEAVSFPKIVNLILRIPVKQMKSKTPGLAGEIHKRLKYKENPEITFTLSDYNSEINKKQKYQYAIKSKGAIQAAGTEKTYAVESTAEIEENYIKLTGEKELDMTDFGLKQPVLLFVKADKKILVKWELYLTVQPVDKP